MLRKGGENLRRFQLFDYFWRATSQEKHTFVHNNNKKWKFPIFRRCHRRRGLSPLSSVVYESRGCGGDSQSALEPTCRAGLALGLLVGSPKRKIYCRKPAPGIPRKKYFAQTLLVALLESWGGWRFGKTKKTVRPVEEDGAQ